MLSAASEGKEDGDPRSNADGVRSTYNRFAAIKGLNETNAPLLFQYLSESVGAEKEQG